MIGSLSAYSGRYKTYYMKFEPDLMVIVLKGKDAKKLYNQLEGVNISTTNMDDGILDRVGENIKCFKDKRRYSCEITIDKNGTAQQGANG